MIGAAIAKRLRMLVVISVNKKIGHAAEQQVEANADDRKKADAEVRDIVSEFVAWSRPMTSPAIGAQK